jgi:hypothetical protein
MDLREWRRALRVAAAAGDGAAVIALTRDQPIECLQQVGTAQRRRHAGTRSPMTDSSAEPGPGSPPPATGPGQATRERSRAILIHGAMSGVARRLLPEPDEDFVAVPLRMTVGLVGAAAAGVFLAASLLADGSAGGWILLASCLGPIFVLIHAHRAASRNRRRRHEHL